MTEAPQSHEYPTDPTTDLLAIFGAASRINEHSIDTSSHIVATDEDFLREAGKMLGTGLTIDQIMAGFNPNPPFMGLQKEARLSQAELDEQGISARLGLKLTIDPITDTVRVEVQNASAFSGSLRHMTVPANPTERKILAQGLISVEEHLMQQTRDALACQHPEAYFRALKEKMPTEPLLTPVTAAKIRLATAIPEYAKNIAEDIERISYGHFSRSLRLLSVAHTEGLLAEWAAASHLQILDTSEITIERLVFAGDWQRVKSFLEHLRQTAPGSKLLEQLRNILITNIRSFLDRPTYPQDCTIEDKIASTRNLGTALYYLADRSLFPRRPFTPRQGDLPTMISEIEDSIQPTPDESQIASSGLARNLQDLKTALESLQPALQDIIDRLKKIINGLGGGQD